MKLIHLAAELGLLDVREKVDGHIHVWDWGMVGAHWGSGPPCGLQRNFTAQELCTEVTSNGFAGAVVVQAMDHHQSGPEETELLLSHCAGFPYLRGAVISAPLREGAEATRQTLDRLNEGNAWNYVRGVRQIYPQDMPGQATYLEPDFIAAANALREYGLTLDLLGREKNPGQYDEICQLLKQVDLRQKVVINHMLKPATVDSGKPSNLWFGTMKQVAARGNVWCKISGLPGEASLGVDPEKFFPFYDDVHIAFGSDRLFWGSDYPVSGLRGAYSDALLPVLLWIQSRKLNVDGFVEKLFSTNVKEFYGLSS